MVSAKFDPEANALYIRLSRGKKIAKTIPLGEGRYLDITESGKPVGIELILSKSVPKEAKAPLRELVVKN